MHRFPKKPSRRPSRKQSTPPGRPEERLRETEILSFLLARIPLNSGEARYVPEKLLRFMLAGADGLGAGQIIFQRNH